MTRISAVFAIVAWILVLGITQLTTDVMPGVLLSLSTDTLGNLPTDFVKFGCSGGCR